MCKRSQCYFNNLQKCSLGKKKGFCCSFYIEEIDGIEGTKNYYDIVNTKNSNNFTMKISIFSLSISILVLLISFLRLLVSLFDKT